jgi:hypothetical protein
MICTVIADGTRVRPEVPKETASSGIAWKVALLLALIAAE